MLGRGETSQKGRISCAAAGGSTSKLEDWSRAVMLQRAGRIFSGRDGEDAACARRYARSGGVLWLINAINGDRSINGADRESNA
jgi:hypothetical protein